MRIDPKTSPVSPVALNTARDAVVPKRTRRESATVVKLSTAASAAAETRDAEAAEKVARLRELIDSGRYQVDLEQLAARIVEDDPLGGDSW
jgi:anti-sigma28 factor (negative regulator of flagellin synthesis)